MSNFNTKIGVEPNQIGMPDIQLVGKSGNAFAIMAACKKVGREFYSEEEMKEILEEMMSGDYDHLLVTAMEFFEVH